MGGALDILTYHAVTPGKPPIKDWCFLPARKFAAQMRVIKHSGIPVLPLAEAVDGLVNSTLNRRAIAITFDDGYQNNVTTALPILERHGFPATVFPVSGVIDQRTTIWPSRVNAAVAACQRQSVDVLDRVYPLATKAERVLASRALQALIKSSFPSDPGAGAEAVEHACGTANNPEFERNHDFAMLDTASIRTATATGLIEFGAHTVTHPILSELTDRALRLEIHDSVGRVTEATGRQCRLFAYPNGALEDFDSRAIECLRAAGIDASVTTVQAQNRPEADRLRLSRWDVGDDMSLTRFTAMLFGLHRATG
jgi:peptidoglycan/xylan/chitin deacetylase (PgdA/CDA1 family)